MRVLSLATLVWAGCAGPSAGAPSATPAVPTSPADSSYDGGGSGCADLVDGNDGRCVVTPPGAEGERAKIPAVESPTPEEDVCASWSATGRVPIYGGAKLLPEAKAAYARAMVALHAGRMTEAIEAVRQCLALEPGYCMAWRALGITHGRLGQGDGAAAAYTDYVCLCSEAADVDRVRELLRQHRVPR